MRPGFRSCSGFVLLGLFCGPVAADARDEVVAAVEAMSARKSYRATTETTIRGAETMVIRTTVDAIPPSRFHVRTDDGEVLIVPEGAWQRTDGPWRPFEGDARALVAGMSHAATPESLANIRNARDAGAETVRGCESSHLVYDVATDFSGQSVLVRCDLWVCDRTGLPIRITTGDDGGTVTLTADFDFDRDISISKPE